MKKLISSLLAAVIAVGMAIPTFAAGTVASSEAATNPNAKLAPFTDVATDSTQGQAILKMYEKGYLAGYEDGTFRPNGYVTRAELVRIINQVFAFTANDKLTTEDFTDNSNKNAWFYQDVKIAQQMGYINGFGDNSFRPKDNFTRQQACVVLSLLTNAPETDKAIEISDAVAPWAADYVNSALASGLFTLEENNTFRATENITRGELCVALAGFVKEEQQTTNITKDTTEATTEATTDNKTETTTKKNNSSSTGGGSSSNSSSNKTTTKATTTTTEATTEATTSNNKETTNKNNTTTTTTATTTTTEATTELTTVEVQVDAALLSSVNRTIRNLTKYVIPNCTSSASKEVAQDIADAMTGFKSDSSYDVQSAANEAMDKYHALNSADRDELKRLIVGYCAMSDLAKLRDTFFPGLTIG